MISVSVLHSKWGYGFQNFKQNFFLCLKISIFYMVNFTLLTLKRSRKFQGFALTRAGLLFQLSKKVAEYLCSDRFFFEFF